MRVKGYIQPILGLAIGLLVSLHAFTQTRMDAMLGRIEARMLSAEQEEGFSGVVLISKGEKTLFHEGYGWASPDMTRKNSLDRRFMIASVSKAFVAACILQLEEDGKLNTADYIGKYLKDYPAWAGENITVHQLLTHTSGIPDYINDFPIRFKLRQLSGWAPTHDELIASFKDHPLNFYPGDRFKYSNSGYVLLAKIVENVSGQDYGEYLYRNILAPLKMEDTGVGDFNMVGNRAVAFNRMGSKLRPIANFKSEWIYGMGELYSTAGDLNKWLLSFTDTLVLSEASKEKMFSVEANNYGYGWHIHEIMGHSVISHGGYLPGWNSYVYYFPEDTISIVVVSNSEDANPMEMCSRISRILYLNGIHTPEASSAEKYAGRYEMLEYTGEALETPFEAEIVTVNETEGVLQIKTPRGKTVRFTRLDANEWTDPEASLRVQFHENGESVFLQVFKNDQEWRWRKLSGDFRPTMTHGN